MKTINAVQIMACALLMWLLGAGVALATDPCGDLGECKVLIEINSSDGDIGFHWLIDADDLVKSKLKGPDGEKVFRNRALGPLAEQKLTETFGESSEPFCKDELKEEEDDEVVTLEEFIDRWDAGVYKAIGRDVEGERLVGETHLTHWLPAAPADVEYIADTIFWTPGTDLGECATEGELNDLVADGVLPIHPMMVPVETWEVVLELEDGSNRKFVAQLPAAQTMVTVSPEFLSSLPDNTLAKVEVGALGGNLAISDNDNATFTEIGDICLNESGDGCEEEEEDEEED